jgi:hypothetical protein
LNWHIWDGHTLREKKQEWKEESDIVFWLRKYDGLVRRLRVRAASSVSLRALMSTDFPQTIRDNFRVADNTPGIILGEENCREESAVVVAVLEPVAAININVDARTQEAC